MFNRLFYSFALCTIVLFCFSQGHSSCDGQRYKEAIFSEVETVSGIKYSQGKTIGGSDQELFMDIYMPKGDTATKRAVIILAFGGSFIEGDRLQLLPLCTEFAKRGFVAASIDYRLYDKPVFPLPTTEEMIDVVTKAMLDMQAAVNFLHVDAESENTYGIAPDLVIIGGVSAGSITASNYAMLDFTDEVNEDLEVAFSNNEALDGITNEKSRVPILGVINFSGALQDAAFIDSEDPAVISFHDRGDDVVPYDGRDIEIFGQKIIYVEGSSLIDSAAREKGVKSDLITFGGDGHVTYLQSPSGLTNAISLSSRFMFELICDEDLSSSLEVEEPKLELYPNPVVNRLYISDLQGIEEVSIINSSGKIVIRENTSQLINHSISVADLPTGVYLLRLSKEDKTLSTKFVKR